MVRAVQQFQRLAREGTTGAATQATETAAPAAAAIEEEEPAAEAWGTMEVREGDTMIALASWFAVSPFDIAVVNGRSVDDYLVIGETLVIPVPESQFALPPEPDLSLVSEQPVAIDAPPAAVVLQPAPTPPPTAAPTLPPSSGGSWTADEVVAAICSLPWDCETMVAIAACESGLRPNAHNPAGYYGLFQINYAFPGWDDPYVNAQVAYEQKYLPALNAGGDGTSPWPVCRHY
jgi:hypothetical protein